MTLNEINDLAALIDFHGKKAEYHNEKYLNYKEQFKEALKADPELKQDYYYTQYGDKL